VRPQEYAKAIVGGILAGLGVLALALDNDVVTAQEWVNIAVATLTVFSSVFGLPNAPKKDTVSQKTVTVSTTDVVGPAHRAEDVETAYDPTRG
jgi:hypothetical protein